MNRVKSVLLPAILPLLQLFVFGPLILYAGNTGEFDIGFGRLLVAQAWIALTAAVILIPTGALLPEKGRAMFASVFTGLSLLLWIQSSFLIRNYGQFGSNDVDWAVFKWAGWIDGALWVAVLAGAIAFADGVARLANYVCGLLGGMLAMLFLFGLTGLKPPEAGDAAAVAPDEVMQFSRSRNVVHFVFDELQSTLFAELLADPSSELSSLMEGFTFFRNTTGSFPTTIMSMPAIHSGRVFDNALPARAFSEDIFNQESLTTPNVLADAGYAVDLVSPHGWQYRFKHRSYFKLPVPYGAPLTKRIEIESATLRNLVLFRHAPHAIKSWIARNVFDVATAGATEEKVAMPEGDENADGGRWVYARHFAHRDFMKDLVERMHVAGDRPTYKFIHSLATHYPSVYNPDGSPAGTTVPFSWETIRTQVRVTLAEFVAFLKKSKQLGIYDNMTVVLHSDHGYYRVPDSSKIVDLGSWTGRANGYPVMNEEAFAQILCAAQPTLAIKPPQAKGPVSVSMAPASLSDLPATIADLTDVSAPFPGVSVFKLGEHEPRKRTFAYYSRLMGINEDYFEGFVRYNVSGDVADPNSWTLYEDDAGASVSSDPSRYAGLLTLPLNEPVVLDETGLDRFALGFGFHPPGESAVWTELSVVDLVVRLPAGTRSLSLAIAGANLGPALPVQSVEVEVNGRTIRHWLVKGAEMMSIPVSAATVSKGDPVKLTLRLPDSAQRSLIAPGNPDTRRLGIALASITATDAEASVVFPSPFERDVIQPPGRLGLFGIGWGAPSPSGRRWSVGKKAILRWRDDPLTPMRSIVLACDRVYTGPNGEPQRVRVSRAGTILVEWRMDQPGELVVGLPPGTPLSSGWTELELEFPDAHSPSSRGEGPDPRELAIQITGISLR